MVNQKPELANYSHFARLFKSQLLQVRKTVFCVCVLVCLFVCLLVCWLGGSGGSFLGSVIYCYVIASLFIYCLCDVCFYASLFFHLFVGPYISLFVLYSIINYVMLYFVHCIIVIDYSSLVIFSYATSFLQMCEEERSGSDFRSSSMLNNLQKSNPEKFQRC